MTAQPGVGRRVPAGMGSVRILLVVVVAVLLVPSAAHASSTMTMSFEAPSELLDDGLRDSTLDEIRAFGVGQVRALAYWDQFAPEADARRKPRFDARDPAAYPAGTWDRLDRLFAAAGQRAIRVQLTLTGPVPRWATSTKRDHVTRPDPEAFEDWVTAVGRRYGSTGAIFSIWNEPNHPDFLGPQFVDERPESPRLYRRLYLAALRGLGAAGVPSTRVLFGETAPRGTPNVVAPLAFLRGALCLDSRYRKARSCGLVRTGGIAHHAYTTKAGPFFEPASRDDVTIGVLPRLIVAVDRAAKAGALPRGLGIFLTEFGIQSTPDPFAGVSLARQSEYLAVSERMAYANPRVKWFSQYLMRDDQPRPGDRTQRYSGFESGLRTAAGEEKPAYRAFALPLAVTDYGRTDVIWGRVRPAGGATTVTVQVRGRGGKRWHDAGRATTNRVGVYGLSVTHKDGRRYRAVWAAPGGRTLSGPPIRAYAALR